MKKLLSISLIAAILAVTSVGCGGDAPKAKNTPPAGDGKDKGRGDVPKN